MARAATRTARCTAVAALGVAPVARAATPTKALSRDTVWQERPQVCSDSVPQLPVGLPKVTPSEFLHLQPVCQMAPVLFWQIAPRVQMQGLPSHHTRQGSSGSSCCAAGILLSQAFGRDLSLRETLQDGI